MIYTFVIILFGFTFVMDSTNGGIASDYTSMSLAAHINSTHLLKDLRIPIYTFDSSGYFDFTPVTYVRKVPVKYKEGNLLVHDPAAFAFKRNRNSYFQLLPDKYKSLLTNDSIGVKVDTSVFCCLLTILF